MHWQPPNTHIHTQFSSAVAIAAAAAVTTNEPRNERNLISFSLISRFGFLSVECAYAALRYGVLLCGHLF